MFESWHMGKFIRRLPSPSGGWTRLVKANIIATGNYRTFVQQCRSNTCHGRRSALSQALGWHRDAQIIFRLAVGFAFFELIKYRLLALVRRDALLGNLQYLDCLLLGRFRYLGRTNKIGTEIASVFFLWFLIYRLLIHLRVPKFKFYMFEFLMASREEVEQYESQADQGGAIVLSAPDESNFAAAASDESDKFVHIENYHHITDQVHPRYKPEQRQQRQQQQVNSLFYLRSQFDPSINRWILRPNRTSESWLALTLAFKFMCYWSVVICVFTITMMYWSLGGSVLTNFGYEMSYPTCVAWLRDIQFNHQHKDGQSIITHRNNYSHLYLAPRVLAHEFRIDDVPARMPINTQDFHQATTYGLLRITFDIIENHLIYADYIILFVALFNTLVISSVDVILNVAGIRARLCSVLEKLEARLEQQTDRLITWDKFYTRFLEANVPRDDDDDDDKLSDRRLSSPKASARETRRRRRRRLVRRKSSSKSPVAGFSPGKWIQKQQLYAAQVEGHLTEMIVGGVDANSTDEHLSEEICNLQAILVDHFDTITRGYNKFVSFLLGLLGFCWLNYTLVVCNWIGTIRSRAVEFEFVLAETNITCTCMIYLSGAALIRSRNMQLYPLIARAMALDPDCSRTKLRWATILKYFHPRPFYCFTVLENTEISWLFCLKLLSWIVSAFVLLANFYYMNRF